MNAPSRGFGGIIGSSMAMQRVYGLITKVSAYTFPVLITGETGTGKELVARSIHFAGVRKAAPFLPVDCAGFSAGLIESELYGHRRGSFTGAVRDQPGLLASAGEGTLFLDEIGELPLALQSRLLRCLQEGQFRAIGSTSWEPFRARVVAATHRDVAHEVKAGTFREDLLFRLNVVNIVIPPLRERMEDIPLLVESLIEKHNDIGTERSLSEHAIHFLQQYDWPGNVRELENIVQRCLYLSDEAVIGREALEEAFQFEHEDDKTDKLVSLDELEQRAIRRAIREADGNKVLAAQLLGIGKTTLYRKIRPRARLAG